MQQLNDQSSNLHTGGTGESVANFNIYHFDTSDQREEPVYKSHIAHLSVRYKK